MPEVTSLPFIDTIQGRPERPIAAITEDTPLVGGFVLREEDPVAAQLETLHWLHRSAAARLLLRSGILPNVRQINEHPNGTTLGGYTPQHLDGMIGRFYQINTPVIPEVGIEAAYTTVHLARYDIDQDQHEELVALCGALMAPDSFTPVWMRPPDFYFSNRGFLSSILNDMPESLSTTTYGTNCTVVFPNGYNALPGSKPDHLWLHSFQSSKDIAGLQSNKDRTVIMSRIADPASQAA